VTRASSGSRRRVAIVTGAGGGIGRATAQVLAGRGLHVVVADVADAAAAATVELVVDAGGSAEAVHLDVGDASSVSAVVDAVAARHGRLDVLINNAAVLGVEAPVDEIGTDAWQRTLRINLTGAFLCARSVVPHLKRGGGGRIVNVASRAWLGAADLVAYSVSKGGLISLTRSLAIELGPYGITVNTVSPTAVATPMHLGLPPEERAEVERRVGAQPIPRLGRPEDVAFAIAFFTDEEAGYITGQQLYVGGGAELRTSAVS
jgi:NAD(P)-dependent dehydrogenase (short-subunit alcohol dehydrogenase family)